MDTGQARQVKKIGSPYFEHLTLQDGLAGLVVRDIVQDNHGFMWFATNNGLNRYDGFDLITYRPLSPANQQIQSLSHHIVHELMLDSTGVLWIGTGQGLNRFDPATGRFNDDLRWQTVLKAFATDHIMALHQDKSGNIWVATFGNGLAKINTTDYTVTRYRHESDDKHSISGNRVTAIAPGLQNTLWVGTLSGLNRLDLTHGRFTLDDKARLNEQPLTDLRIEVLLADKHNQLWIGTTNGLNRYDLVSGQLDTFFKVDGPHRVFTDNAILSLFATDDGRVWAGTQGGIHVYQRQTQQFDKIQHNGKVTAGIASNTITAIMADRAGVLWFGSDSGVNKLSQTAAITDHVPFSSLDSQCLTSHQITTVLVHGNNLWLGSFDDGLFKINLDDLHCLRALKQHNI